MGAGGRFDLAHPGPPTDDELAFRGLIFRGAADDVDTVFQEIGNSERQPGTDVGYLDSLPVKVLTAEDAAAKGDDLCFCYVDYEAGDEVVTVECGHSFHASCIRKWLESSTQCPVCRHEMPVDGGEAAVLPPPRSPSSEALQPLDVFGPIDLQGTNGDWFCPEFAPSSHAGLSHADR